MDREPEELPFMGFFSICTEAYKILLSWQRVFTQITLSLILPLSFIFLAHIQISNLIIIEIAINEETLETTRMGSPSQDKILNCLSSKWTVFLLFKAAYLLCILIFALLSTSAFVYNIACIYTTKDLTYFKVMSIMPKVSKRLIVTFLSRRVEEENESKRRSKRVHSLHLFPHKIGGKQNTPVQE